MVILPYFMTLYRVLRPFAIAFVFFTEKNSEVGLWIAGVVRCCRGTEGCIFPYELFGNFHGILAADQREGELWTVSGGEQYTFF